MRLVALIAGCVIYLLGLAQVLWIAGALVVKAWSTWSAVFGVPGKVFTVVLFPIALPLAPVYLGLATGDWRHFWRLLILGIPLGLVTTLLGGMMFRAGAAGFQKVSPPTPPRPSSDSGAGDPGATLSDEPRPESRVVIAWDEVVRDVGFRGPAPELQRIVDQVSARTGLAVSVTESNGGEDVERYDLYARLALVQGPEVRLEIFTFRTGGAPAFAHRMLADTTRAPAFADFARQFEQVVYLRWKVGGDPLLLFAAILALEALGGRPRDPLSPQERRDHDRRFTAVDLDERRRSRRRHRQLNFALNVLALPFTIPYWLVRLPVTAVWVIRKAFTRVRREPR